MTATIKPLKQKMIGIELSNGRQYCLPEINFLSWCNSVLPNMLVEIVGLCELVEDEYIPYNGVRINMSHIARSWEIDN